MCWRMWALKTSPATWAAAWGAFAWRLPGPSIACGGGARRCSISKGKCDGGAPLSMSNMHPFRNAQRPQTMKHLIPWTFSRMRLATFLVASFLETFQLPWLSRGPSKQVQPPTPSHGLRVAARRGARALGLDISPENLRQAEVEIHKLEANV